MVDLKREYAGFFTNIDQPYDALLDDFEPGAKTSDIQRMFDGLRRRQVALLKDIERRPQVDDSFLHAPYAEADMLAFAVDVISKLGFDWQRGRQDKSAHPFATGISTGDVRITTRFVEGHPFELLFSMLHETGHAMYEQGVDPRWNRTALTGGASLGVHESQSRLWENLIGRSRSFWIYFFPQLQRRFPAQLGQISIDEFYNAINKVQPSLIRVEADEVTYNLHVMLRVEMEIDMLNGTVSIDDVETYWNDRMRDYLGVAPSDAAHGVLQDMHWSVGLFGYFPTYTIGNLLSVQLWRTFQGEHPSWEREIVGGEFSSLREWLRERVHRHGKAYRPSELVQRITGKALGAEPYLAYLEEKYS
jgi:carboxypeptidase Taq